MTYLYRPSSRTGGIWGGDDERKRQRKKRDSGKLAIRPDHPRCRSAMWICVCGYIPEVVSYSFIEIRSLVSEPRGIEICLRLGQWLVQAVIVFSIRYLLSGASCCV